MEASVATPGQGAPAGVQPGTPGQGGAQGQPTAAGKGGDAGQFWGNFPNVPVEQHELLEPHLKEVQGYVTRMESQYAPYKSLTEIVTPENVENLVGFLNAYNSNGPEVIMGLVQEALQEGSLTPEQVQSILGPQQPAQAQPGQADMPEWAQQMQQQLQQYEQKFGQFDQAVEAQRAQEAEAENAQVLETAKQNIRGQLTTAGISEDAVSDELIVASIIASNGDEQAAANLINQTRQNFLSAFTQGKTGAGAPAVQGNLPQAPQGARKRGDGFDEARGGAKQYLEQQAQMAATG